MLSNLGNNMAFPLAPPSGENRTFLLVFKKRKVAVAFFHYLTISFFFLLSVISSTATLTWPGNWLLGLFEKEWKFNVFNPVFIQNSSTEFPFPIKGRQSQSAIMCGNFVQVTFTLRALGCLWANLYKSSEARCVRLNTKSNDGPISSSSILGVRQPDFFNRHLCVHITSVSLWWWLLQERTEWLLHIKVILNQFLNS